MDVVHIVCGISVVRRESSGGEGKGKGSRSSFCVRIPHSFVVDVKVVLNTEWERGGGIVATHSG